LAWIQAYGPGLALILLSYPLEAVAQDTYFRVNGLVTARAGEQSGPGEPWRSIAGQGRLYFGKGRPATPVQFEVDLVEGQPAESHAGKLVIKSKEGAIKAVFTNASITRERPLGQPANLQLATSNDAVSGTGAYADSHGSGSLSALVVGSHLHLMLDFGE
jgi:hypothetical protein